MTEDELAELLREHPRLWHMAEAGSWPSIRAHGLLSTSALLDRFGVEGAAREAVEAARRPQKVRLGRGPDVSRETSPLGEEPWAVVRDNKPLNERKLARALQDGLTPPDWYRLLNARVFLWLSRERLLRLLGAQAYRDEAHDVIEVESAPLLAAHRSRVTLSPINSGATGPFAAPRGLDTFRTIEAYPYAERRRVNRREPAVELAVLGGVPDLARFATRVVRMRGDREEAVVWARGDAPPEAPGSRSGPRSAPQSAP